MAKRRKNRRNRSFGSMHSVQILSGVVDHVPGRWWTIGIGALVLLGGGGAALFALRPAPSTQVATSSPVTYNPATPLANKLLRTQKGMILQAKLGMAPITVTRMNRTTLGYQATRLGSY